MSTTASSRHTARGFTLLEVLVALVVVALGMSALLETLTQSARNLAALRDRTVAEWIAMNQLALARLNPNAPTVGVTQGDVQNCANGNWHWLQSVSAMDAIPGLMSITVSVRRTGNATNTSNSSKSTNGSSTGAADNAAGMHPGATGQLGPNISLAPTAALGSITSLNTAGCASFVTAGGSLGPGSSNSPGQIGGSIGASGMSLGSTSGLAGPAPGPAGAFSALGAPAGGDSGSGGNAGNSSSGSGSGKSSTSSSGTGQWLVTLTGFRGNTLGAANGETPNWTGQAFAGESGANGTSDGGITAPPGSSGGLSGTPPRLGPR